MSLVLGKNPSNELKEIELTNSGLLKVDVAGSSGTVSANVDVTGNTIGLATSANQSSGNASLATLAGAVSGSEFQCDVLSSALPTGAATSAAQSSGNASLATLAGAVSGTEFQVDVVTSALPSGAATSAAQSSTNANLASLVSANATETTLSSVDSSAQNIDTSCSNIDTNTTNIDTSTTSIASDTSTIAADTSSISAQLPSTLGQTNMANSLAVVLASNQSSIPVTTAGASTTNVNESLAPGAGGTATSTAVDMDGSTNLTIFGSSTNATDQIVVQVSHNNSTWVEASEYFINMSASGGNFAVNISNTGARYFRVSQTDTLSSAFTLTVNSSKK